MIGSATYTSELGSSRPIELNIEDIYPDAPDETPYESPLCIATIVNVKSSFILLQCIRNSLTFIFDFSSGYIVIVPLLAPELRWSF